MHKYKLPCHCIHRWEDKNEIIIIRDVKNNADNEDSVSLHSSGFQSKPTRRHIHGAAKKNAHNRNYVHMPTLFLSSTFPLSLSRSACFLFGDGWQQSNLKLVFVAVLLFTEIIISLSFPLTLEAVECRIISTEIVVSWQKCGYICGWISNSMSCSVIVYLAACIHPFDFDSYAHSHTHMRSAWFFFLYFVHFPHSQSFRFCSRLQPPNCHQKFY